MTRFRLGVAALIAALVAATATAQQTAPRYRPPRLANGHPDLQGIWQVRNTANWNLQAHGGSYKTPAGYGVVVDPPDGAIPYRPEALTIKAKNWTSRDTDDPLEKFDMSGNFQSEHIHVVERYTLFTPDTIHFVATIEDATMYTRPWTLNFSLERNQEPGYYQLEYACHEGERDLQHFTDDTRK